MIEVIGHAPFSTEYETGATVDACLEWLDQQDSYQLDVETNVTEYTTERRLRTIQFGEIRPGSPNKMQWVLVWPNLSKGDKIRILKFLQDHSKKKYIHNASFEYQTFLNYGLVLENVYDTLLVEKVLFTGHNNYNDEEGNRFFSLAAVTSRRLGITLDKEMQTAFDFEIELTEAHILYAAQDVQFLDTIAEQQQQEVTEYNLTNICNIENEACMAFADIEFNGMRMDTEKWMKNLDEVAPIIDR
jgi:ribonuclease D